MYGVSDIKVIASVILILGALYVGVSPVVDIHRIENAQITLIAGAILVSIDFRGYVHQLQHILPTLIGGAVLIVMGLMERNIWGMAGCAAIVVVVAFSLWRAPANPWKKP